MLDSISISNFKAIQDEEILQSEYDALSDDQKTEKDGKYFRLRPLKLEKLANVNYLVGKNGCGKSSVLEALAISYNDLLTSKISQKVSNCLKDISQDNTYNKATIELKYKSGRKVALKIEFDLKNYKVNGDPNYMVRYVDINNDFQKKRKTITIDSNFLKIITKYQQGEYFKYMSTGELKHIEFIKHLYFSIQDSLNSQPKRYSGKKILDGKYIYENYNGKIITYILICEEPEIYLYPGWQKLIPNIINEVLFYFNKLNNLDIKLIVTTHSPFIISESAKYGDQKVYLLDNGKCLNPEGSKNGGAKKLAMQMLGAGADDILPKFLIICEGSTNKKTKVKEKDSKVLNAIFGNYEDVIFYSSDGCDQVLQSACALKVKTTINPALPDDMKIISLTDFDSKEQLKIKKERQKIFKAFGVIFKEVGSVSSKYKELEDYLFDDSILDLCNTKYGIFLNRNDSQGHRTNFCNNNIVDIKKILNSKENDKQELKENFQIKILARLITPDTKIYNELYDLIFT